MNVWGINVNINVMLNVNVMINVNVLGINVNITKIYFVKFIYFI